MNTRGDELEPNNSNRRVPSIEIPHGSAVDARLGHVGFAQTGTGRGASAAEVNRAQRLQGPLSAAQIAELIGVHERTVRSCWHATTCQRYGGPQISALGSCPDCIPVV